jgi:hypothetical protein
LVEAAIQAGFQCILTRDRLFSESAARQRELQQLIVGAGYFRDKPGYLDCNDSISLCKSLFKSASVRRCFSILLTE